MIQTMEFLKIILLGVVEGVTEWLPVSSTGHMLLVDQFIKLEVSESFMNVFLVVIQFGAILAVVVLFWEKMFPFQLNSTRQPVLKTETIFLWFKVAVACIPGAVVTFLLGDTVDEHLHSPEIIAAALIFYGVAFILIEKWNRKRKPHIDRLADIGYRIALGIGLFQALSIIPGTSRSGATIIGALLLGVSRTAAAEFTFFLAVPVMVGLSSVKIVQFGFVFSTGELLVLAMGMVVAFIVSLLVVKFLMNYIRKHDFTAFGWYRIALGLVVLAFFALQKS